MESMRFSLRRESRVSCQVWGRVGAGEGDGVAETAGNWSHQHQWALGEQTLPEQSGRLNLNSKRLGGERGCEGDMKLIDLPLNQSSSWRCFCPSRQLYPLKLSWSFLEIPHRILWVYITHFWRTVSAVVVPWVFWFMHSCCMGVWPTSYSLSSEFTESLREGDWCFWLGNEHYCELLAAFKIKAFSSSGACFVSCTFFMTTFGSTFGSLWVPLIWEVDLVDPFSDNLRELDKFLT